LPRQHSMRRPLWSAFRMSKGVKDKDGNTYTYREDNPYIVATNSIYIAEENPDIYIKVLKHPSLLEFPTESSYIRSRIENELNAAKVLSDNFFPAPHVYYTKITVDSDFIVGHIVMERIKGRVISGVREFNRYFDKIFAVLNDLLEFGIIYSDMNIHNFIVGEEDDEIYLIDFEDIVSSNNIAEIENLVTRLPGGGIKLNREYIREHLKESAKIRKKYKMVHSPTKPMRSDFARTPERISGATSVGVQGLPKGEVTREDLSSKDNAGAEVVSSSRGGWMRSMVIQPTKQMRSDTSFSGVLEHLPLRFRLRRSSQFFPSDSSKSSFSSKSKKTPKKRANKTAKKSFIW